MTLRGYLLANGDMILGDWAEPDGEPPVLREPVLVKHVAGMIPITDVLTRQAAPHAVCVQVCRPLGMRQLRVAAIRAAGPEAAVEITEDDPLWAQYQQVFATPSELRGRA